MTVSLALTFLLSFLLHTVILSQSAIDRGLFRSIFYRTYRDEEKRLATNMIEEFDKPNRDTCVGTEGKQYDKLEQDGLVAPGTRVRRFALLLLIWLCVLLDHICRVMRCYSCLSFVRDLLRLGLLPSSA